MHYSNQHLKSLPTWSFLCFFVVCLYFSKSTFSKNSSLQTLSAEDTSRQWVDKEIFLYINNYNCHNIYWDPLIWLVKNGHLIALTCISFFNEPGPYSWGAGPFTTELLLWYCAMLLWREMDSLQLLTLYLALAFTPIFSGSSVKQRLTYIRRLN